MLILIVLGLVAAPARVLQGSTFRVTPIRLDLDGKTTSAVMTLTNQSTDELRFQVSCVSWKQTAAGEMDLKPTDDLVAFPALLTIKAGEERNIRIGRLTTPAEVEKAYRVLVEELPPPPVPGAQRAPQVRIITKMSVPVFVAPTTANLAGAISDFSVRDGKLAFAVTDTGNVHFMIQNLHVTGFDAAGKELFSQQRDGWYVLPGTSRRYDFDIPPTECAKTARVRVDAATDANFKADSDIISTDYALPPNSCKR